MGKLGCTVQRGLVALSSWVPTSYYNTVMTNTKTKTKTQEVPSRICKHCHWWFWLKQIGMQTVHSEDGLAGGSQFLEAKQLLASYIPAIRLFGPIFLRTVFFSIPWSSVDLSVFV